MARYLATKVLPKYYSQPTSQTKLTLTITLTLTVTVILNLTLTQTLLNPNIYAHFVNTH